MAKAAGEPLFPPPSTSAPLPDSTAFRKLRCGIPDPATQGPGPSGCLLVAGVRRHSDRVGVGRPRPARLPAGRVALPPEPPEVFLRHALAPM